MASCRHIHISDCPNFHGLRSRLPQMTLPPVLLICIGACFGAAVRWQLGIVLNRYGQVVAVGTLAANWLGCFLAGVVLGLSPNQMCRLLLFRRFMRLRKSSLHFL